jgi:peptide/nickel transport system permease protein
MSLERPIVMPVAEAEATSLWRDAWRRLYRNKLAVVGLVIIVALLIVAIFGPFLSPYDFLSQSIEGRNEAPSWAHWFGTDGLGRDVLSRLIYGARTALMVALVVTGVALVIGVAIGAAAGFAGGMLDRFLMWLTDITMSVPSLLLVIVINASLKPPLVRWMDDLYQQTLNPLFRDPTWIDFVLVFGSMALITWPPYARLVRAQVLSIRSRPYVLAARALGLSNGIILRRHVMPNALGPLIVAVSAGLGTAMVLESAFSFLGVGVNPPTPSWGNMIQEGLRVWQHYPYLLAGPAAVLGIATVAFSFLGDGLNDALNPRGAK